MKKNTGNRSTGNKSTGDMSTGDMSTGNWSTGHWSTGNWSTGSWSTGNWSTSDRSTGHFSTIDNSGFGAFNKPCTIHEWAKIKKPNFLYFKLTEWVQQEKMSDEEKENNQMWETTGGYLKVFNYKQAFQKSWDNASEEDKALLFKLPNFDVNVFKEISGIDVNLETFIAIKIPAKKLKVVTVLLTELGISHEN